MDEFAMLGNIRDHSITVARVADALLSGLTSDKQARPARDVVIAGALLHDIAKTKCLQDNCDHSLVGSSICRDLGYTEVAEIVLEHVILRNYPIELHARGIFLAKELVYYADKRVLHDQVVSLDTRLEYILERYGLSDPKRQDMIRHNFRRCQDLENAIFRNNRNNTNDLSNIIAYYPVIETN